MYSNHTFLLAGGIIVSYILYVTVTSIIHSRRRAAQAKKWGCVKPHVQKNSLPLGIDQVQKAVKADKAGRFPHSMAQRHVDVGISAGLGKPAYTFKQNYLGAIGHTTAEPENIKFMLAKGFEDFDLGPVRRGNFFPLLGNGIFTQDGKPWEHSRAMIRPSFSRDQVSDLDLEETHLQNLMKALPVNSDGWTDEIDIQVLFFRLTLDSATEFLFGESVDSQITELPRTTSDSSGNSNENGFANAFDTAQKGLAARGRFGDRYWVHNPKPFQEACKACHDFIDHFVRLALSETMRNVQQEKDLSKAASEKESSMVKEKYIFLEALAAETQDPIELRSQLLHILLAGRDTTASHLSWLFLMLSQYPDYYQKLRTEIIQEFGTYETCDPSTITFSKLKSCSFLQRCNNESLRLYPVVPMNGRRANKDTYLPTGGGPDSTSPIFIPKGTNVDYAVWVMHRRKDLWGEDADVFRPERWETRRPGWEFLPFNGGPRICIGQQFALTEASYVTVRLLQKFDEMRGVGAGMEGVKTGDIACGLTLTMCPRDGVKVRLREARK